MDRRALFVVGLLLAVALLAPAPALAISPVSLDQDWNLRADGGSNSENLGVSLTNAGDINGDGVDDMVAGAVNASEAVVIYGQPNASRTVIDAASLIGAQGYRIKGIDQQEAGLSVANAGDVNGDDLPDQVIGAAGVAYVVFGQRTPNPTTIDLANLGTPGNHQGYRILDGPDDGLIGTSSAGVGDVNGDGIPDQLVGGSANHNGRTQSGSVYVLFGQRGSVADIELGTLTPAQGYRIDGADTNDVLGTSVAAAGDVDGDGIPDFLMGAGNRNFMGRLASGSAYLIYGRRSSATPIDLALLTPAQGYEMGGTQLADAGNSVADAGDVDGDGVPDALVGAPATGRAYIVFGQRSSPATVDLANVGTTGNRQGTLLDTPFNSSSFGFSVAAGDVNGDGILDAIVGDSGATAPPGAGYVVFGRRPSPERISTAEIGVDPGDKAGIVLLNEGGGPTPGNGVHAQHRGP